ncbi:MAG: MATE family efflux transporter [Chitinophagaceae bacterium]|nr:MAG: MATE family efflux transporter [Chitinophagaceae bacterium]
MSSLQVEVTNRQILKIALPISLALLVPNLNFIINNVFLGHLSEEALAIASITGVYYLIFSSIGYGLNNGLQALIARRAGENRPEEIGKIFHQGVLIAMGIALIGIITTFTLAPAILRAVVHHPGTADKAITFLQIRIWGLPFLYIYQMRNALLVGTNNSRLLVAGTLIEAVANVLFDWALIFGNMGLPALGFNGAAFASIIAEFLGMFAIFVVIRMKGLDRRFSLFKKTGWDPENIRSILSLSGPLVFQHAISIIAWFFFYILIERNSGQTGLAVSNTMRNIFGFFGVFVWAFAATSNAMVSNIIGQGRQDQVIACIKKIQWISLGLALGVFVFLNAFPALYLSIYGLKGAFVEAGVPVIRVVSAALVLMSVATIWLNAVTGTGNSRVTFLIELGAIVFYCVYVFTILEKWQGTIVWAWMSEFLYWTVLFTGSYFYIKKGKWREKKI